MITTPLSNQQFHITCIGREEYNEKLIPTFHLMFKSKLSEMKSGPARVYTYIGLEPVIFRSLSGIWYLFANEIDTLVGDLVSLNVITEYKCPHIYKCAGLCSTPLGSYGHPLDGIETNRSNYFHSSHSLLVHYYS